MLEIRGGFRVSRQQSDSADNRPDTTSQNGAETPATKAASEAKKHWLDYATAFLTLAAAGGAITAAVFTGWQATQQSRLRPLDEFPLRSLRGQERERPHAMVGFSVDREHRQYRHARDADEHHDQLRG